MSDTNIQRYDPEVIDQWPCMEADPNGEWVKYTDVMALEQRIAELEAREQAAIDGALQSVIDAMPVGSIHACDIIRSRIGTNPLTELQARLESQDKHIDRLITEMRKLQAENDELRADAERYRLLRAQHWTDNTLGVVRRPKDAVRLGSYIPSESNLDSEIDALRQLAEQENEG